MPPDILHEFESVTRDARSPDPRADAATGNTHTEPLLTGHYERDNGFVCQYATCFSRWSVAGVDLGHKQSLIGDPLCGVSAHIHSPLVKNYYR